MSKEIDRGLFPTAHTLLAVVAALLLGGGRFSALMGDVATGVKNFKKGMLEDDDASSPASSLSKPAAVDSTIKNDRMAGCLDK